MRLPKAEKHRLRHINKVFTAARKYNDVYVNYWLHPILWWRDRQFRKVLSQPFQFPEIDWRPVESAMAGDPHRMTQVTAPRIPVARTDPLDNVIAVIKYMLAPHHIHVEHHHVNYSFCRLAFSRYDGANNFSSTTFAVNTSDIRYNSDVNKLASIANSVVREVERHFNIKVA